MYDPVGLREHFQHVYWIGGGSGAGKSTVARQLAMQHDLDLYATDLVMAEHASRISPNECPFLQQFIDMDLDERWVTRSPQTMLETFHWFRGEGFDKIVEDLLSFPPKHLVLVEGFRVLPHLVQPLLSRPGQAVWLLPTPEFRQKVFELRGGSAWSFIGKTSNPQRALSNLLERDRMFTDHLNEETKRLNMPSIQVHSSLTERELVQRVIQVFGFRT